MSLGIQKPPVDIIENTGEYIVFVDLPGVEPEDIEIKGYDNYVEITGIRKPICGKNFLLIERFSGRFKRKINFKSSIDINNATAILKNGVLMLQIPKAKNKIVFTQTTIIIRR